VTTNRADPLLILHDEIRAEAEAEYAGIAVKIDRRLARLTGR
jgi:hypothetical protein